MGGRRINEDGALVDWWSFYQEKNLCIRRTLSKCNFDWLPEDQSECNFDFNYSVKGFKSNGYYKYSHVSSVVQRINKI
jgi:hypothetical protein